jgi:hypothetical protein
MSERPFEWKRDGGGLALFVVGAFVSVLMVKTLASDQPLEQLSGTAAIAALFAGSFGALPCLVVAAGAAFLGARSFVTASEAGALRHALGLIGCALGLTVLCGALSDTAGGRIGLWTGGWLGLHLHLVVGCLAGLSVVLATTWFTWLREPSLRYEEQIRSSVTERPEVSDPGVTAAEAAGLIPEELPQVQVLARRSPHALPQGAPPSPYPEDVRLKGQVPSGARPIANTNAAYTFPATPRVESEPSFEPLVERVEPLDAGSYLAPAAPAPAPSAVPAPREVRPLPAGVRPLRDAAEELSEREQNRVPVEELRPESVPERPSWERTGLTEDDEPVDAYGTPLSLVESLRKAREELVAIPETPPEELEPEPVAELAEEQLAEEQLEEQELAEDDDDGFVEITQELVPAGEIEDPAAEARPSAQTTIFDFTGEEPAGVELFPEGEPEPVAQPAAELFEEPAAQLQAEAAQEIEIEVGEEPEVILQPQATPPERAHKSLSVDPQRAKLLAEVGCLFVERGRVAVSMLQRQYGMDFGDACKVLDELQDLGLIGPYLGGQRRDILLTRDQWLEKTGAA